MSCQHLGCWVGKFWAWGYYLGLQSESLSQKKNLLLQKKFHFVNFWNWCDESICWTASHQSYGVPCSSLLLAASPPGFRNSILMYLGSLPLYLFIKYFAQCLWLILSYDFIGKPVMPWNLFPCCLAFFIWILMSFLGILTLNCFSSISYIMNCFPLESFYFIFLSLYIWKNVKILWNIYSKNNFSLWHHSDGILNSLG